VALQFIGGKGLGAHLLLNELDKGVDPLSPASIIAFFTGPLTGTRAPSSNRYGAFFKSPLTGIWGESYAGGYLAPQMKRAGYDGIILTGKAS
jgi:aldehyde:ferredoxin oxidoreductase